MREWILFFPLSNACGEVRSIYLFYKLSLMKFMKFNYYRRSILKCLGFGIFCCKLKQENIYRIWSKTFEFALAISNI